MSVGKGKSTKGSENIQVTDKNEKNKNYFYFFIDKHRNL